MVERARRFGAVSTPLCVLCLGFDFGERWLVPFRLLWRLFLIASVTDRWFLLAPGLSFGAGSVCFWLCLPVFSFVRTQLCFSVSFGAGVGADS
jgi:hypothetical protein